MPVEERREPLHGAWRRLGAADILAKRTPHPFLSSNWELLYSRRPLTVVPVPKFNLR